METKGFFQYELSLEFRFILVPTLWVYDYYKYITLSRQILTSNVDFQHWMG